jgi:CHAT domain-containing protein/tetratricopeptide (TPR) repeat protein
MKTPKKHFKFPILYGSLRDSFLIFVFVFFLIPNFCIHSTFAQVQSIPQNPNAVENGKKQGRWTLLLSEKKSKVSEIAYAKYYRLIEYKDDQPVGIVKDYYLDGQLQMEGVLLVEGLAPKFEGKVTFYRQKGIKDSERLYENGKFLREIFFNLDGSIVTQDWQKLYDQSINDLLVKAKYQEAIDTLAKAKQLAEKQYGKDKEYATCLIGLSRVYRQKGEYAPCEALCQEAIQIRENFLGKTHPDYAAALTELGSLHLLQGNYLKAQSLLEEALKIAKKKDANPTDYVAPLINLGSLYLYQAKYNQAQALFEEADQIFRKAFGDSSVTISVSANNLAQTFEKKGKYAHADSLYQVVLAIKKKEYGEKHPEYGGSLSNRGILYVLRGKYAQADSLLQQAKALFEDGHTSHPYFIACLNNLAALYKELAYHDKADSLFQRAKAIQQAKVGTNHHDYATILMNIGNNLAYRSKYAEAEASLLQAKAIYEQTTGTQSLEHLMLLNSLAMLYNNWGKYKQAEPFYWQAQKIYQEKIGENHPDYASLLNNMALWQANQGQYAQSFALQAQALRIYQQTLEHPDYASLIDNIAFNYHSQANFMYADSLYRYALALKKQVLGTAHPSYGISLMNLASLYRAQHLYAQAEPLFLEAGKIFRQVYGENHVYYSSFLNALAVLYADEGRYAEAEKLHQQALHILEQIKGLEESDTYALTLGNLAGTYQLQGKYAQAEPMLRKVLDLIKKSVGEKHEYYATTLSNLVNLYTMQSDYAQALPLANEALQITKEVFGENHPDYAHSMVYLASIFRWQKAYSQAEQLLLQAKAIMEKGKWERHPTYEHLSRELAVLYDIQGRYSEALPLYRHYTQKALADLQNNFTHLSESNKQKYVETYQGYLKNMHHFLYAILEKQADFEGLPTLLRALFDLQLSTKGMLLAESEKMKKRILASGDSSLIQQYQLWNLSKNFLSKAYNLSADERAEKNIDLARLQAEVEQLEKGLYSRSADFEAAFNPPNYTSQDLQATLGEDEVAIDLARFTRIENWDAPQPDTLICYLALVLTKNDLFPILLKDGREMEGKPFSFYRSMMKAALGQVLQDSSYNVFWKPIGNNFVKVKKIYFAPDGVYHSINLNTLKNPASGRYLAEDLDIHIVTNLKELLQEKKPNTIKKAALFGRPAYKMSKDEHEDNRRIIERSANTEMEREINYSITKIGFSDLVGTEIEVKGIEAVMKKNYWAVETILGKQAIEERLKKVRNPSILHIATHGYFRSTNAKSTINGMLRSGIVLAGVNTPKTIESDDGVLTAQEASSLDLDETDLVVLSACETGLGEVSTGEGVYGLQRGFKVAGAKAVVMSLWKVDDTATQELMNTFYELWLSGKPKREAFKEAQLKIKDKYKYPYYWGAFVMVGE